MGMLPDGAASMVQIAYKNSGRLVRIINDILDIGKLEAGELTLQMITVPLAELVRQSIEANLAYAERYQVHFQFDDASGNEQVIADPDRLMQVMTNLLSNAAKFSPPDADVQIRVRSDQSTLRVEVEDFGTGIPEAFKDRIFEQFAQADASAARRTEGSGLGLSIARKLIEAMHGDIGFTTVVGSGTVFYLNLPRADLPSGVPAKAGTSPRLLYVMGDDELINVIRKNLAGKGEFIMAQGWQDAERLMREESFELVVLDDEAAGILVERNPALGASAAIVVLAADAVPAAIRSSVTAVVVKTQASVEQIAATILSYLPPRTPA
jgi:hypothetical protein